MVTFTLSRIARAMRTTSVISAALLLSAQPTFAVEKSTRIAQIVWNEPLASVTASAASEEDDDVMDAQIDVRKLPNRAGSLAAFSLSKNSPDAITALSQQQKAFNFSKPLTVSAKSAMVLDAVTGEVLYGKASDKVRPIASITKLMTAMVTADARLDMHEIITLQSEDFKGPKYASSQLRVGDQLNRAELLLIALMHSENPAASALARTYPKGWTHFIQAMNDKAKSLGMNTAYFGDPTGLDVNNVASAHDLATMVRAASQYGVIRSFSSTPIYNFNLGSRVLKSINTNAIVRDGLWDVDLSKTGHINEAGNCVVMQAQVNQRPAVIVLLGADSTQSRTGDAKRILNWLLNTVK